MRLGIRCVNPKVHTSSSHRGQSSPLHHRLHGSFIHGEFVRVDGFTPPSIMATRYWPKPDQALIAA